MKEIFIGSSSESIELVNKIGDELDKLPDIKTRRWYEVFPPGILTYEAIEKEARRVAGAIFIATPDDVSVIRRRKIKVPRANVLLELGYFSALLERQGIALCKYDETTLPTDLQAFTHIPMGKFEDYQANKDISLERFRIIKNWAGSLLGTAESVCSSALLQGYSGRWQLTASFERWRENDIHFPDFVTANCWLDLQIDRDGKKGFGIVFGDLNIRVKNYRARIKITDEVSKVDCHPNGSISFITEGHSRERIDNFGGTLQETLGISDGILDPGPCEWRLNPVVGEPSKLTGYNEMKAGTHICDRANINTVKIH